MNENRNLLLAFILSAAILIGWQYFLPHHQAKTGPQSQGQTHHVVTAPTTPTGAVHGAATMSLTKAIANSGPRIIIDTPSVDGSLRLNGARFDDLKLKRYHLTINPKSPQIDLLAPEATAHPYYSVFGWVAAPGEHIATPGANTPWKLVQGNRLTPRTPITLSWNNGQGLVFTRTIAVDDNYMFTIRDRVTNTGDKPVTLFPYAYVARENPPATKSSWYLHQGFIGVAGGSEKDADYSDFKGGKPPQTFSSKGGWFGITDKYWMAAVIPPQNARLAAAYRAVQGAHVTAYQADYRLAAQTIAPHGSLSIAQHLFAGAKVVQLLDQYSSKLGITHFDLAVDWGWFWFFTKPIFFLLDTFYHWVGNFGVAILLLTVTIKLAFFPLANTSFKSMSRMKKLQPEMERIRQRFADDKQRQQQELMDFYKREKVNPVSGCLPMLIQMPVFFSLYKVLYVTIEMRHAPFFGWIQDLSAPDPTSILNLFGLLPYHVPLWIPAFLSIGIWPILMGFTQFLSTRLNPAPADPIQAQMFTFMPIIFTFMMAGFPAGLVIYWTWNNLLTATQQYVVMRRQGVEVHLLENLKLRQMAGRLTALFGRGG